MGAVPMAPSLQPFVEECTDAGSKCHAVEHFPRRGPGLDESCEGYDPRSFFVEFQPQFRIDNLADGAFFV